MAGVTMRISIVGTYHAECGAVTASALLEILEGIDPEVIFAEIPATHHHAWRSGSHGTVESLAVARYAEARSVDVVPVDLPEPEDAFFRHHKEVSRAIERTSPEFRRLVDLHTYRRRRYGFTYLNSDACRQDWAEIYREEVDTIEYIGDPRLTDVYARFRDLTERRDVEMLRNIRAYCASTGQTRGAFLVGTAHRNSLIEKVRAADEAAMPRIDWDISGWQTGLGKADISESGYDG